MASKEETIKVQILPCGKKAKELNPLGRFCPAVPAPTMDDYCGERRYRAIIEREQWQQAENNRREFVIEEERILFGFNGNVPNYGYATYEPGTIHSAVIIEGTNTIKIL